MATCRECGRDYDREDVVYALDNAFNGEIELDEDLEGMCEDCAVANVEWLIQCGKDAENMRD